jgi:hypothetical protein
MGNTILAGNDHCLTCGDPRIDQADNSPDCYSMPPAVFTSLGGNMLGVVNNNCNHLQGFQVAGTPFDQVGEDPLLGPLKYNGGPTITGTHLSYTHALLPESPAIDKAYLCPGGPLPTDQRGAIRGFEGTTCDVGAYELGTPEPITTRLEINRIIGTYNRVTNQFTEQVTLKNPITGSRIPGQVFVVLDDLNLNLPLVNKDGDSVNVDPQTPPSPYRTVDIGANHVLAPGEQASVTLIFYDPSPQPQRPQYTVRVLAGAGVP